MIKHTYHVLEFYKLLQILSGYASCPLGRKDCLSLKPSCDPNVIDIEQKLVSETKLLLKVRAFSPLNGLKEISPFVKRSLTEGACLEPDILRKVYDITEAGERTKKAITSQREICPLLYDKIAHMTLFQQLKESISRCIHLDGTIKDSASTTLGKLRRKKSRLRRELQKRLEDIRRSHNLIPEGDDHLISIRDGRYIIPIRTEWKNRIQGIVHDYSRTQATCFFEPLEAVEDNNRLAEVRHLENEEELKILTDLTAMVRDSAEDLLDTQALLGTIDGLYARARFSETYKGVMPVINRENRIDLRKALNPILLSVAPVGEPTVPVDIHLDRKDNVLVISGPNRGGKTVTLKTLGLLSLMAQAGLHIPAEEGSQLPVFKNILAEIGDDQDIRAGLSTFSAHISHLKYIMENAGQDSLVIIDEPGMGTDPDEGSALAMALLDDLIEKDALVVVSTHYNRLKTYGLLNERAENACMEFDETVNSPTFMLRYGTPGTSYAFEVARNHGIEAGLLARARDYLDREEIRLNRLIDKLNMLIREAESRRDQAERVRAKYQSAKEKMMRTLREIRSDKKALMEDMRDEAEQVIRESREKLRGLINSLKEKKGDTQAHVQERHEEISRALIHELSPRKDKGDASVEKGFMEGQVVRHKGTRMKGRILAIDSDHSKAFIMSGKIKLSADLNDLQVVSDKAEREQDDSPVAISSDFSGSSDRELNLIGYRVEEALPLIDRMIDRSMIEGGISLRIVHGHGTGTLKTAIRDHLKNFSCIKRIGGADPRSGGEAITIVELQ